MYRIIKPTDNENNDFNILVIVDMQNDFIDGALANPAAKKIVTPICQYIEHFSGSRIFCTRDTHYDFYLNTQEGRKLPVEHCLQDTPGRCINDQIYKALRKKQAADHTNIKYINKETFGYYDWQTYFTQSKPTSIALVGTCTSVGVVANAIILKALFPAANITVLSDLCADKDEASHEAALLTLKNQQININTSGWAYYESK